MIKRILLVLLIINLIACGDNVKPEMVNNKELLAQALSSKIFSSVTTLKNQVRMTENTNNIIHLFEILHTDNIVMVNREIDYIRQFIPQMNTFHQEMLNEMMKWLYLKKIYTKEISPPVRILQREALYLAPSGINFSQCTSSTVGCAIDARKTIALLLTNDEIKTQLKKMALKDPCVNLSSKLQGEIIANRCLKKSKGNLTIEILPLPRFSTQQWMQVLNSES